MYFLIVPAVRKVGGCFTMCMPYFSSLELEHTYATEAERIRQARWDVMWSISPIFYDFLMTSYLRDWRIVQPAFLVFIIKHLCIALPSLLTGFYLLKFFHAFCMVIFFFFLLHSNNTCYITLVSCLIFCFFDSVYFTLCLLVYFMRWGGCS